MSIKTTSTLSVSNTKTLCFSLPAGTVNNVSTINIVNDDSTDATVRLYIGSVNPPTRIHLVESVNLAPGEPLVRSREYLEPDESIYVEANSNNVVVRVSALIEPNAA